MVCHLVVSLLLIYATHLLVASIRCSELRCLASVQKVQNSCCFLDLTLHPSLEVAFVWLHYSVGSHLTAFAPLLLSTPCILQSKDEVSGCLVFQSRNDGQVARQPRVLQVCTAYAAKPGQGSGAHPMGSPSSGSKVQTTMSLSKGKHQQSFSAGASLQLEKLGQLENPSSCTEKLASGAALSPRATEEESITAFLGDKEVKRRTRSSQGLELNCVALRAEDKKSLSFVVPLRGHSRGGSGNVTPKVSGSPRAKGICTSPGMEKHAVAKMSASLFQSPTKLERSMSLSRVAQRVIPDADESPRSRTGVGEVFLRNRSDRLAELKLEDSRRELESRLQAVVACRSENSSTRNLCSELLVKKVEGDETYGEPSNAGPFSCIGFSTPLVVKEAVPCANGNYEYSQPKTIEVPKISSENLAQDSMGSSEDSWLSGEHMCWNAAHLPVKDIHPVCFQTINTLRSEELTMSLDMDHDLHETARSCSLSTDTSAQHPSSSRDSNCYGPELAACEPLRLQSGNQSHGTYPESSHRINHPDVSPTSNSCSAGLEISYQDIKEVMLPRTCGVFETEVSVCNQGNEAEKNGHSISFSSDKVAEARLITEAGMASSLECVNSSALILETCKQAVTDATSQDKDVNEIHFSPEKEIEVKKINRSEACLRKSNSFELGEKRKVHKRRRSVSASGIGAMLLKTVRTSEPESQREARSLSRAEPEVSNASHLPPTTSLHQDAQFETQKHSIEAVDMDVEYEDCSSELVTAPETEIACHDVSMEDSSDSKDTKRPSEEVKLQLEDDTQIKNYTEEGQSELALHDSQEEDEIAGSGSRNVNEECDKRVISSEMTGNCNPHNADIDPFEEPLLEERFLDARDKSLDRNNSFGSIEPSSPSGQSPNAARHGEKITNQEAMNENARANGHKAIIEDGFGGSQRRRRHGSRGRMSHDFDSSYVAIDESRRSLSLVDENLCMITSLERSRSFAAMLQVSPRQSVDESNQPRLAPSSIAILTNPSFSSSHQDRLWEEQAEYSSGGRGTPGRDDDAAGDPFLLSPSPGGAISSDDQMRSAAASLRKNQDRDMSASSCAGFASDSGHSHPRSHEKRKFGQAGKKRGRPQRSPLRNLLAAEDLHDKSQRSPERGHFLHQILSRIRGKSSSPKSSPHKSSETTRKRRSSTIWSSCMCFSHVK